jgi:hypothetical protein
MKRVIWALFVAVATGLHGATAIMPLQEIQPGMKGYGLTVFEGDQIERFEIEVIDVVRNFQPQRDLIVIKLLGERINHTGVVAGMSGSPIYINEKLIGALAYRMGSFMKDAIAGVTPIGEMLEIFNKESVRTREIQTTSQDLPIYVEDYLSTRGLQKFDLRQLIKLPQPSDATMFVPIETPLVVSGASAATTGTMASLLQGTHFTVILGGQLAAATADITPELQPGAAVAGTLVSGDFDISAVGTVTYREGDNLLAFGHPFFNSGPVNIPMSQAKVIATLSSLYASNKFAIATKIIGNIRQDRSTGIMGLIGEIPPLLPVQMEITSPLTSARQFRFAVANDRSSYGIMPVFLWMTIINALESARLGNGDYGLTLDGRIDLENADDVILTDFYSGGGQGFFDGSGLDASEAAYDIVMTLSALLMNRFEPVKVKKIELSFQARPGQHFAEIEKIFFDKMEVRAGDSLHVLIFLRPYHGKIMEFKQTINIPAGLSADRCTIAIGGRNEITNWELQAGIGRFSPSNFAELVAFLNQRRQKTQIIIQLKIADQGMTLHGRQYPTLPPSVYQTLRNPKTQNLYQTLTEKIVQEWRLPIPMEIKGGRKFDLRLKRD